MNRSGLIIDSVISSKRQMVAPKKHRDNSALICMRFRKLRIAWSVLWGLACVLLIVLWVRSYRGGDSITLYESNAEAVPLTSTKGHIELLADNDINANPYQWVDFVMNNNPERQSVSAIYAGFEVWH